MNASRGDLGRGAEHVLRLDPAFFSSNCVPPDRSSQAIRDQHLYAAGPKAQCGQVRGINLLWAALLLVIGGSMIGEPAGMSRLPTCD